MGKRLPHTPNSRLTSALRRLWMWSRERAAAKKAAGNKCSRCGSREHLEVHHIRPANMQRILDTIREELLCGVDNLVTLCRTCHKNTHKEEK